MTVGYRKTKSYRTPSEESKHKGVKSNNEYPNGIYLHLRNRKNNES